MSTLSLSRRLAIRPSFTQLSPTTLDKGVAGSITVNGVTYTRIYFGGAPLDMQISSQPLYGKA